MNFQHMPEFELVWGYPAALVMIAAGAVVPLVWFRRRGWL